MKPQQITLWFCLDSPLWKGQLSFHRLLSGLLGLNPKEALGTDQELWATGGKNEVCEVPRSVVDQVTLNDTNHLALEEENCPR